MMNVRKNNRTRAQSLVEMAVTLPAFLLLILGFIDLGRAVYYYSALGNAVREGARYASVQRALDTTDTTTQDNITDVVTHYSVSVPISAGDVVADRVDVDGNLAADGLYVRVSGSVDFDPVIPFLNPITMSSETTMLLAPYAR
jgi:Flp pilus assembly protein TadG